MLTLVKEERKGQMEALSSRNFLQRPIISEIIANNHWLLFIILNGVLLNRDYKRKIYLLSFR